MESKNLLKKLMECLDLCAKYTQEKKFFLSTPTGIISKQ